MVSCGYISGCPLISLGWSTCYAAIQGKLRQPHPLIVGEAPSDLGTQDGSDLVAHNNSFSFREEMKLRKSLRMDVEVVRAPQSCGSVRDSC